MTEPEAKSHCDHGWIHVCGGPHDSELVEQDVPVFDEAGKPTGKMERGLVSVLITPIAEGGCKTIRCDTHCSCFAPEGVHEDECALAVKS